MKYQEFKPNILLRPYIDRYFTMATDQCLDEPIELHLPPNGTSGILLQCGDFYKVSNRLHQMDHLPKAFVMGQPSECFTVEISGKFEIIGVRFTPAGLHHMFGLPMHELTDHGADANQLLGKSVEQIGDRLWDCPKTSNKAVHQVAQLEVYFLSHLPGSKRIIHPLDLAVDKILKSGGKVEITRLAEHLKVSRRTLERHFYRSVGMYPKQFCQIARLNRFFKLAQSQPDFCWHDLIHTCGYYDQSHFIHNFQSFMHQTPTQYWENFKKQDNLKKSVSFSCRGITADPAKVYQ